MTPSFPAAPRSGLLSPRLHGFARNARLLVQAFAQHAADDPALLAVQISRRLPWGARRLMGLVLASTARWHTGLGALGFIMAGRSEAAESALEKAGTGVTGTGSALAGEVAILLNRTDLLGPRCPARTRARASWSLGDLDEAVEILEATGLGDSRQAQRLHSEIMLLQPRHRLSTTAPSALAVGPSHLSRRPQPGERLRVLHLLTNSLPHTQSGYSLRSHRILRALRAEGVDSLALTRTGYPVMVGVPLARDEDDVDGIRYLRTLPGGLPRTPEQRLDAQVVRALEVVAAQRPHIIHTTTNYFNAHVARRVSEITGIPWVFEVRGLMEQTWAASHRGAVSRERAEASQRYRAVAEIEAELARSAHAVVTLSATMERELITRGVEARHICLMPNAVEEGLFEGGVSPLRAREIVGMDAIIGEAGAGPLIGAVSALVDYEGFDVLLRAFALLIENPQVPETLRGGAHLVLVGDGSARAELASLAGHLGIADRVHLPGRVPRTEARRWVEALDLVVVPRRDTGVARSVTPQKPIEAMALGRPLITSDLPALRESVRDVEGTLHACFVPPEDPTALAQSIVALLEESSSTDETRRSAAASRVEAARQAARQRTWSQQVRGYRDVYMSAWERQGGGDPDGR